jgi:hypothetical protein
LVRVKLRLQWLLRLLLPLLLPQPLLLLPLLLSLLLLRVSTDSLDGPVCSHLMSVIPSLVQTRALFRVVSRKFASHRFACYCSSMLVHACNPL